MSSRHARAAAAIGVFGLLFASVSVAGEAGTPLDQAALRHGEEIYDRCLACHAIEANRTGPQHCGPGFDGYSPAMRASDIVWDAGTLDRFLQNPLATVPKTFMTYAGVSEPTDRAALIVWLAQATRPGKACKLAD